MDSGPVILLAKQRALEANASEDRNFLCRYYGLKPDIKVISPWREWDLNSRSKLIAYAESKGIAVPEGKRGDPPFSTDANLLHISYEG
jgi:argininosuccinate synthase